LNDDIFNDLVWDFKVAMFFDISETTWDRAITREWFLSNGDIFDDLNSRTLNPVFEVTAFLKSSISSVSDSRLWSLRLPADELANLGMNRADRAVIRMLIGSGLLATNRPQSESW